MGDQSRPNPSQSIGAELNHDNMSDFSVSLDPTQPIGAELNRDNVLGFSISLVPNQPVHMNELNHDNMSGFSMSVPNPSTPYVRAES